MLDQRTELSAWLCKTEPFIDILGAQHVIQNRTALLTLWSGPASLPSPATAADVAGLALPPSPAPEAAMAAVDQAFPQHRCGGPCCPAPDVAHAASSCLVHPLRRPG